MADITGNIITRTQRRSFLFKCICMIIGSVFILSGSIVLRESLLLGVSMWVAGVSIDLYTIYIVYREMDEIRTDIEAARDEIQDAQEEILQTEMKVEDTAQRIEGIAVDMYDRQGSTDRWGELKTTPENRTRNIS